MKSSITQLTWSLYNSFGNRKKAGRIAFFVDLRDNKIYPVPLTEEHVDFVKKISDEKDYYKIIPSYVDIGFSNGIEKVQGIETGYSGLEILLGIKHNFEDLKKAHEIIIDLVDFGEIPIVDNINSRITFEYAIKKEKFLLKNN